MIEELKEEEVSEDEIKRTVEQFEYHKMKRTVQNLDL
jgi:hypothetical protein